MIRMIHRTEQTQSSGIRRGSGLKGQKNYAHLLRKTFKKFAAFW